MRPSLFLLVALAAPAAAQPDWEVVDLGTTDHLYALRRGGLPWVVGANGFVASVANDFATWTTRDPGTTEDLLDVRVTSNRYVVGRDGTYRYSEDGGVTWQGADLPNPAQDYVTHIANTVFYAFGSGGAIYTDRNGPPFSWVERESGTTAALRAADDGSLLLVVGDGGTMLGTTDRGETWTPVASGTTADLHAVVARGSKDWLVVGEGGLILKSTDNGQTWTPRASGTTATLYALDDVNSALRYLVVGENGTLLETTDLGETWCAHALPTTADLYAVTVPAADEWFVAGAGGLMLRSQTQGGGSCTPVVSEDGPEAGYALSAAWPNPTAGRAALALSVDRPQRVTASVVDRLGRRVAVIFDGTVSGSQTLIVDHNDLAAGAYVVRVEGETFAASRPLSIVR